MGARGGAGGVVGKGEGRAGGTDEAATARALLRRGHPPKPPKGASGDG